MEEAQSKREKRYNFRRIITHKAAVNTIFGVCGSGAPGPYSFQFNHEMEEKMKHGSDEGFVLDLDGEETQQGTEATEAPIAPVDVEFENALTMWKATRSNDADIQNMKLAELRQLFNSLDPDNVEHKVWAAVDDLAEIPIQSPIEHKIAVQQIVFDEVAQHLMRKAMRPEMPLGTTTTLLLSALKLSDQFLKLEYARAKKQRNRQ
ncbi:hypothetical protein AAFN47_04165 [Hoeflea sp. CAU 1731]